MGNAAEKDEVTEFEYSCICLLHMEIDALSMREPNQMEDANRFFACEYSATTFNNSVGLISAFQGCRIS